MSLGAAIASIAKDALPAVVELVRDIGNHPPAVQAAIAERLALVLAEETASDVALNQLLAARKARQAAK